MAFLSISDYVEFPNEEIDLVTINDLVGKMENIRGQAYSKIHKEEIFASSIVTSKSDGKVTKPHRK